MKNIDAWKCYKNVWGGSNFLNLWPKNWRLFRDFGQNKWRIWRYCRLKLAISERKVLATLQSITKKNSLVMAICAICDSFKRLFRTKVKKSWRSKWINRRNDSTLWVLPLKRIYALFRITKTEPSGDWWVWLLVLSVNLWKSNKSLFSSP